jgi:hypothetical protein
MYGIGLGAAQSYKQAPMRGLTLPRLQGKASAEQGREVAFDAMSPQQLPDAQAFSATIAKKYLKHQ